MYGNQTKYAEELVNDEPITKIKVIGVGGAGCNAINRMIEEGIRNVDFIAVNTDMQVLKRSLAPNVLQIGSRSTRGLGAGARPEVGEKAAQEDLEEIRKVLSGSDMVFITAGMGGGTGTGAAPVIAQIAKEIGALTVAVVTLPFEFEGKRRMDVGNNGLQKLGEYVDTMLVISNSRIFKVIERRAGVKDAFKRIDEVLKQAVQGISSIISETGEINVDFADVRTVLANRGEAIMGIGVASGENRAIESARQALENPLIENNSFKNAGAILVDVIGGADFTMSEYDEANQEISRFCRDDAQIIIGLHIDDNMKDKVKIIVVATDFQRESDFSTNEETIPSEDIFEDRKVITLNDMNKSQRGKFTIYTMDNERGFEKKASSGMDKTDLETPTFVRRRKTI